MRRQRDNRFAVSAIPSNLGAGQIDNRQFVPEQDQAVFHAGVDAVIRAVVRAEFEHQVPGSVVASAGDVAAHRNRMTTVNHSVNMFAVLIVDVAIGCILAGVRVRFIYQVAGLIEDEAVVVGHLQLNVGCAFLREARGIAMAGEADRVDADYHFLAERCAGRGTRDINASRIFEQFLAPGCKGLRNAVFIDATLVGIGIVRAEAGLQFSGSQQRNVGAGEVVIHNGALRKRVTAVRRDAGNCGVVLCEHTGSCTGNVDRAHLIAGSSRKREQRHVAVLTTNHLAKRIVGAVVGAGLPLRAEVFEAEERERRRVCVVFVVLQIARAAAG